ncbi:MAG: alpha-L-fucosidase, partial [Chitinophagaceae bacterium]|nr:alpha-L-fucosidase [Chitinophagaceae bacterium]
MRIVIILLLLPVLGSAQSHKDIFPSPAQLDWAEKEIGAIFHLDVVNYVPDYNWRKWGTHPPASVFNPSKLNTDQWILAAKAAGAKYAVLVAKHCSGFSLWPTAAHEYSVKHSPWRDGKGDIVTEFIASCKKYGLEPGIYASTSANGYCYVDNPGKVQPGGPFTQQAYNKIVVQQLTELWSNYGELFEIWFDGGVLPVKEGGPDLAPLLKQFQPDAVVFQGPSDANNLIRWVGNEKGLAPYPNWSRANTTSSATGVIKVDHMNGDPEGRIWCPGEADFSLRTGWLGGWFWKADGQKLLPVEQLVENYITSVGRNSN